MSAVVWIRRIGKFSMFTAAGALLLAAAVAVYLFWPRSYARPYAEKPPRADSDAPLLAPRADAIGFRVGAAVDANEVGEFERIAGRDYNSMTPANALKWGELLVGGKLGPYDFAKADSLVNLARSKNTRVRGHTLVWARFTGIPSDLKQKLETASDPKPELERIITRHVQTVIEHFQGRIEQWDVVNEPLDIFKPAWDDNVLYRTLGPRFVEIAFRAAHAADPNAQLVLNEQLQAYDDAHAEKFLEIVQQLVKSGVPIHGVGLQSHAITEAPSAESLKTYLRRIAALGLFVEITELDARLRIFSDAPDPYLAQGEFYRSVATACLAEPACRGITVWGICDRHTWLNDFPPFKWMHPNDPLLFDDSFRKKPAYFGIFEALNQTTRERPSH